MTRTLFVLALGILVGSAQSVPELQLSEDLRVGDSINGDVTFTRITSIVPGSDDGFYVVDSKETSLTWFDRNGKLIRRLGREGAGPAEFRALSTAGRFSDTLWVMDPQLQRVSLFSAKGEFIRTVPVPRYQGRRPIVRAFTSQDILIETETYVARETNYGSDLVVARINHAGVSLDTIAVLKFGVGNWLYRNPPPTPYAVMLGNPFNDGSLFDTDSKGENLTVVHRTADSRNAYEVIRFDRSGRQTWTKQFNYSPRPITNSTKDSVVSSQYRSAARFPTHVPAVSRVVVGEDGTVWLRREELGINGRSEWNVLSADGRPLGRFQMNKRFQVHVATARSVLATTEDDNDAPVIVRFAVSAIR
jgi:hypothetical protein